MESTYFRKGFGLKSEVQTDLRTYHSGLVDRIRENGYELTEGGITFKLAREFGFCYGVDRAVEYAYQARTRFPDRTIYLLGEIIHNPHVNRRLEEMDIAILESGESGTFDSSVIRPEDVVIIPAFGVTVQSFEELRDIGCVLVDTTCGSVLNVWKRVQLYAREGFTALVHGKYFHEETKATVSQVTRHQGGKYIIVRDMRESEIVCDFIENNGDVTRLQEHFAHQWSEGFDPATDLAKIGVANQTTMLAGESLAIAARFKLALERRYGPENLGNHFRSFDTICSATQDRQDAVLKLIEEPLDAMLVIGGYNSSNTNHLAKICSQKTATYHIEDAVCIDPEAGRIRHKPMGAKGEVEVGHWLDGVRTMGVTAGASTPNNKIGEAIERVLMTVG